MCFGGEVPSIVDTSQLASLRSKQYITVEPAAVAPQLDAFASEAEKNFSLIRSWECNCHDQLLWYPNPEDQAPKYTVRDHHSVKDVEGNRLFTTCVHDKNASRDQLDLRGGTEVNASISVCSTPASILSYAPNYKASGFAALPGALLPPAQVITIKAADPRQHWFNTAALDPTAYFTCFVGERPQEFLQRIASDFAKYPEKMKAFCALGVSTDSEILRVQFTNGGRPFQEYYFSGPDAGNMVAFQELTGVEGGVGTPRIQGIWTYSSKDGITLPKRVQIVSISPKKERLLEFTSHRLNEPLGEDQFTYKAFEAPSGTYVHDRINGEVLVVNQNGDTDLLAK